jgi:hypothetical protein
MLALLAGYRTFQSITTCPRGLPLRTGGIESVLAGLNHRVRRVSGASS